MDIKYIEFKQAIVKGTESEISEQYGEGWIVLRLGKSSNWLVTRPSDILVDGESYRDFALRFYDATELSPKILKNLRV